MRCIAFKALLKNTLEGFASLEMGNGVILHDCTVHRKNGSRWVSPPGKAMIDREGWLMMKDGRPRYTQVVEFRSDEVRQRWSNEAVRCIDEYLGESA